MNKIIHKTVLKNFHVKYYFLKKLVKSTIFLIGRETNYRFVLMLNQSFSLIIVMSSSPVSLDWKLTTNLIFLTAFHSFLYIFLYNPYNQFYFFL